MDSKLSFTDRLTVLFVHILVAAVVGGVLFLSTSNYYYCWKHRDNQYMWRKNWAQHDYRSPKETYYVPFATGAAIGAGVGLLLSLIGAGRRE